MKRSVVTLSDFNLSNFNALLANDAERPEVRVIETPFGQVQGLLADAGAECWREKPDAAVVWTQPQAVAPSLAEILRGGAAAAERVLDEVAGYVDLLLRLRGRVASVFVPTWVLPCYERGLGLLDLRHEQGLSRLVLALNSHLCQRLAAESDFFVLDAQRWIAGAGKEAFAPKLWYLAKVAYGAPVFRQAAAEVKAALCALAGETRKLIVLDLDDTLWGGIVGDVGWENLHLGGHDSEGEAFADFQAALKALSRRGILLGIVSKNDEAVALEAIDRHPEMLLRRGDFAAWRINWKDKAQNLADLVAELNLGLQSVVFIDDNPVERARVREALPEVLVPEWPRDKSLYRKALSEMLCFDSAAFSAEDRARADLYRQERARSAARVEVASFEEWLTTLAMQVRIEALAAENLPRAAQLLNKTNQMNLSTRRMNEAELAAWTEQAEHWFFVVHVEDKFGSAGLTGLLALERERNVLRVVDFVLSCRVMGRKVEEVMLAAAVEQARRADCESVRARYLPTAKNKPCLEFFQRSGFAAGSEGNEFTWLATETYPVPEQVRVEWPFALLD